MKSLVATILVLCLVSNAEAGRFSTIIASAAAATRPNGPAPAPKPAPVPSSKCENCGGTGIVGDGTIEKTCVVCNGTGKATVTVLSPNRQWRWTGREWISTVPVTSGTNAQPRGHWEERVVCRGGRRGCETTRVWVSE